MLLTQPILKQKGAESSSDINGELSLEESGTSSPELLAGLYYASGFLSQNQKGRQFLKGHLTILYVSDVHVFLETGAITKQKDIMTGKVTPGHRADNRP